MSEAATAPLARNSRGDGEEQEQALRSSARYGNPVELGGLPDDASEWREATAAAPRSLPEASTMLAKVWIGLFLAYTATALPLLVWALASVAT